jgi:hypothetical protein
MAPGRRPSQNLDWCHPSGDLELEIRLMTASLDPATATHHIVLRARIGGSYPPGIDRARIEDRIATAITDTITALGGTLDVLQVGLAARPDWDHFGPVNRVSNAPLWDPTPITDGNGGQPA